MRYGLILCMILTGSLALTSCKVIENKIVNPFLEGVANVMYHGHFMPMFNPDIVSLSSSLVYHKLNHSDWPTNFDSLNSQIAIDSFGLRSDNFTKLLWTTKGDSILVNFALEYAEADTGQFKFLHGDFILFVQSDTTMNLQYQNLVGESKDGQWKWNFAENKNRNKKRREKGKRTNLP